MLETRISNCSYPEADHDCLQKREVVSAPRASTADDATHVRTTDDLVVLGEALDFLDHLFRGSELERMGEWDRDGRKERGGAAQG